MSESEHIICGEHGSTPISYACRHLASGVACGFHASAEKPDDRWPDAWCDDCEERCVSAGGWTDELTAKVVKLLCTHCWDAARARNEHVPPLARGRAARLTEDEQHGLMAGACEHLHRTQELAQARWGFDKFPRWDLDDAKRTLTFSEQGSPPLVADVRMIGSYSTKSNSFQWAWALYDAADAMVDRVARLPAFGEVRGIEKLTTNSWECDISEAWNMSAVAAWLLGGEAVYRAPFDHMYWFMLLNEFRVGTT